jgi:cyclic dehypoxanthinyl futalosine synthase
LPRLATFLAPRAAVGSLDQQPSPGQSVLGGRGLDDGAATGGAGVPGYARRVTSDVGAILDRAADGGRITPDEALLLYTEAPLHALGQAADAVRRRRYPDNIATYIIDRNINYTNVCVTACKFCAFYRAPNHAEGWTHPVEEILRRCGEAVDLGATQIMLQGGHSPELGIEWYEQTFRAIKRDYPQLTLHSLGASEVVHIARTSQLDHATVIARLHSAGLDSFAGARA